jgi:hypothetical protein
MIDQSAIIAAYNSAEAPTIPEVATRFGIKPVQVSAILSLHGVKVRRGSGGLTEAARAAGHAVRTDAALTNHLVRLCDKYGREVVQARLNSIQTVKEIPDVLAAE